MLIWWENKGFEGKDCQCLDWDCKERLRFEVEWEGGHQREGTAEESGELSITLEGSQWPIDEQEVA